MSKSNEPFDEAIVPGEENNNASNIQNGDGEEGATDKPLNNKEQPKKTELPESEPLKPQPQFKPLVEKKSSSGKLGLILGGISLPVSIVAVFFALNAANSASSLRDDVNTAFQSVDGSIENFGETRTQLEVDIQSLKDAFAATEKQIHKLEVQSSNSNSNQPRQSQSTLDLIANLESKVNTLQQYHEALNKAFELQVADFKKDIAFLASKHRKRVVKANTKPKATKPSVLENLEGLQVTMIDSWGGVKNAVLFNPSTQKYHYVRQGDYIRDWEFVKDSEAVAIFRKGNDFIKVSIKEL